MRPLHESFEGLKALAAPWCIGPLWGPSSNHPLCGWYMIEPEQHKIAVSEGGKRLEAGATELAVHGNGLLRFPLDGDLMALLYAVIHSRPPALRI